MTTTAVQLDIAPLSGTIGAEIRGLDLHRALDPETLAAVRQALLDYKVIFFPGQHLSPQEHKDFAAAFGEITVAHPVIPGLADHKEVFEIDYTRARALVGGTGSEYDDRENWHTDVTFVETPPLGSIINAIVIPEAGGDTIDVAVLRLRFISNFTDADALSTEPGVRVRFTRSAADLERADLVVIPGTKATVEDMERIRDRGLDRVLAARAAAAAPILGICGGYQMLGERIDDEVESGRGTVAGLGLLRRAVHQAVEHRNMRQVARDHEHQPQRAHQANAERRQLVAERDPFLAAARPVTVGDQSEAGEHEEGAGNAAHAEARQDEYLQTDQHQPEDE